jgi:hypothetical protein
LEAKRVSDGGVEVKCVSSGEDQVRFRWWKPLVLRVVVEAKYVSSGGGQVRVGRWGSNACRVMAKAKYVSGGGVG